MPREIIDIPSTRPVRRLRRLRRSPAARSLVSETKLHPHDLVQPLFIKDSGEPEKVPSMPGVERIPLDRISAHCAKLQDLGLHAVALFPCTDPALKDPSGTAAFDPENLICRGIKALKKTLPELLVVADVALDPYTSHGHDGLLDPQGDVDNDRTVAALERMAVLLAHAGADWVAPSDMMDGRVAAIRTALDDAGCTHIAILAYSAKFASAFYGPFRDAIGSASSAGTRSLDKRTYQLDPANRREALLEAALDEEEGADALMVKPAGPFLDIIREIRERTDLPLAAYQVSGEYAQIHAAAQLGWLDLKTARDESLVGIKRAGADFILTYFAESWARDYQKI